MWRHFGLEECVINTNFHESFATDEVNPPSERATGLVFTGVAVIVALLWHRDLSILWGALSAASALVLISLVAPVLLKPLNILWLKFGLLLHRIVSPVALLALFVVVFVPVGAIMRLWHDPLRLRRKPEASSYWICRSGSRQPVGSMINQF
jgi:hypothetical protein